MTIKNTDQPVDQEKYGKNYEAINWSKKKCKCGHALGGDCKGCKNLTADSGKTEVIDVSQSND